MNKTFWQRFPAGAEIRCVEMKDQVQERVARDTLGVAPDRLVAYFREASQRFWREMGRPCPESAAKPIASQEADTRKLEV
jgi:hypothetical protein